MKTCRTCGISKPLGDFHRLAKSADGHQPRCKDCVAAYMREYHKRNAAHIVAKVKAWREANPERATQLDRKAQQRSKVKHRDARARRSREAKVREKQQRLATKAAQCRGCEECGAPIPPDRRSDIRFCTDECQRRVSHRRHRARNRAAFVEHVDPLVVLERDDNICGICGGDVDPDDFHIDHIVPLARGGLHNYENTQAAHPSCNWAKSARVDYQREPCGVTGARY